jgi:hypothetical protein
VPPPYLCPTYQIPRPSTPSASCCEKAPSQPGPTPGIPPSPPHIPHTLARKFYTTHQTAGSPSEDQVRRKAIERSGIDTFPLPLRTRLRRQVPYRIPRGSMQFLPRVNRVSLLRPPITSCLTVLGQVQDMALLSPLLYSVLCTSHTASCPPHFRSPKPERTETAS